MESSDELFRQLLRLVRQRLTPRITWGDLIWIILPTAATITMLVVIVRDPSWVPDLGVWQWQRRMLPGLLSFLWPLFPLVMMLGVTWVGHRLITNSSEWWAIVLVPVLMLTGNWLQQDWFAFAYRQNLQTPAQVPSWMLSDEVTAAVEQARSEAKLVEALRDYEESVKQAGTKTKTKITPPGGFFGMRGLYELTRAYPKTTTFAARFAPSPMAAGIQAVVTQRGWNEADYAVLMLLASVFWWSGIATALVLFLLMRLSMSMVVSWWSAAFWLVSPGILLFYPQRESFWPFLSCTIILLTFLSVSTRRAILAILAGAVWLACVGTNLSFAVLLPFLGIAVTVFIYRSEEIGIIRWMLTFVGFWSGVVLPLQAAWYFGDMNLLPVLGENIVHFVPSEWNWDHIASPQLLADLDAALLTVGPAVLVLAIFSIGSRFAWNDTSETASAGGIYWGWLFALLVLALSRGNLAGGSRAWLLLAPLACPIAVAALFDWRIRPVIGGMMLLLQGISSLLVLALLKPIIGAS